MYATDFNVDIGIKKYSEVLGDISRFNAAIDGVFANWQVSCEQFLTNVSSNRIAWIGQASVCYDSGVPRACRGGFILMDTASQLRANELAGVRLNEWLRGYKAKSSRLRRDVGGSRVFRRNSRRSSSSVDGREASAFVQGYLFSITEE